MSIGHVFGCICSKCQARRQHSALAITPEDIRTLDTAARKRVLVVFDPLRLRGEALEEQFREIGIEAVIIETHPQFMDGPDIRLFDLDGLPEADLGKIKELTALPVDSGAVRALRDRCAKIARDGVTHYAFGDDWKNGYRTACSEIAALISAIKPLEGKEPGGEG